MNSIEDVYNRLYQYVRGDDIGISLSDDKELITIELPDKGILASDDMVEIHYRKKLLFMKCWALKHWHPATFEDLYEGLLRQIK